MLVFIFLLPISYYNYFTSKLVSKSNYDIDELVLLVLEWIKALTKGITWEDNLKLGKWIENTFNEYIFTQRSFHIVWSGYTEFSLSPCSYLGGRKYERVVAPPAPLLPNILFLSMSPPQRGRGAAHPVGRTGCGHWVWTGCWREKGSGWSKAECHRLLDCFLCRSHLGVLSCAVQPRIFHMLLHQLASFAFSHRNLLNPGNAWGWSVSLKTPLIWFAGMPPRRVALFVPRFSREKKFTHNRF